MALTCGARIESDFERQRLGIIAELRRELAAEDAYLDNLARVAARACDTKFALVSLVGESWQTSAGRFAFPLASLPVKQSICPHAIGMDAGHCTPGSRERKGGILTVPDTADDPRFRHLALVTGFPHIRFYAGLCVSNKSGLALGTLCVLDDSSRPEGLNDDQLDILDTLARSVADYLDHILVRMRLRDSESRFRAIAQSGAAATWRADREGRLLEQQGWQQNTGKDIGEALGSGWLDSVHPDDRTRIEALVGTHLGKGEPISFRYRSYFDPGEYRWVENRATPIFDARGDLKEWAGAVFDIHEETIARDALHLSEERYRALVDMSAALVWRADADGVPQDALHSSHLGQFDFSPQEWVDNIHPDDRESATAAWQEAIENGSPMFNLERKRTRDGSYRWVQVRGMPLHDDTGHLREWIGMVTDVHDLIAAREAIESGEERYRLAAAASSDVIWDFDPRNRTLIWNEALATLFSYDPPPGGTTLQWWEERIHPQDRARVASSFDTFIDGSAERWCAEYRFRKADGSYAEVIDQGIRQRFGDSDTIRIVGSIQDVTARNAAQRHVRESEERLRLALNASRMVAWERMVGSNHTVRSENGIEVYGLPTGSTSLFRNGVHPDDRARVVAWLEDATRPPGETIEFRFFKPDGEMIWLAQRAERPTPDRIIGITWDISDRKAVEAELWQSAHRDTVTGAANRNYFQKELSRVFGDISDKPRALILLDVDAFKEINDTAGHEAGDQLLRAVAAHVQRSVDDIAPERGFVARIGGDEFALVLKATTQHEVERLAKVLLDSHRLRFTYAGKPIQPSLSLGIVVTTERECEPAELMKDADMALYRAKQNGKGRYVFFDLAMRQQIQARIEICHAVREAAAQGAFVPYYQPKLCLRSNRIIGFEALARWRKEDGTILFPADFAAAFEDHAAMLALGRSVRCAVSSDIRTWKAAGLKTGPIAINLSTAEFSGEGLVVKLMALLERKTVAPEDIEIEVTENVFMGDASGQVQQVLERLHAIGVSIALDDFGTGFASLTHIRDFPVDRIKIDKRFVSNLLTDRDDSAIVNTLINLGSNLGKKVIAEGVETRAQMQRLQELGCDEIQGYVIARPMPADAIADFLAHWETSETGAAVPQPEKSGTRQPR